MMRGGWRKTILLFPSRRRFLRAHTGKESESASRRWKRQLRKLEYRISKVCGAGDTMHPWETALGAVLFGKKEREETASWKALLSLALSAAGVLKGNEFVCEN